MFSEEEYRNEIRQLHQQIANLHQHIQRLNDDISQRNLFEYHFKKVTIDKVKGTLQIGHLMQAEIQGKDGIHRFFIEEVTITEVEDTGTVGIGVTEKYNEGGADKSGKVSPEETTGEVKEIYDRIRILLGLQHVPEFIQKLAVNEKVLRSVWDQIHMYWSTTEPFERWHALLKERADQTILHAVMDPDPSPGLGEDTCIHVEEYREEYVKTLLLVIFLIHGYLPGYLKNQHFVTVEPHHGIEHVQIPDSPIETQRIMQSVREAFHLRELPTSFEAFEKSPRTLRYIFQHIVQPVSQHTNAYLQDIHMLVVSTTHGMPETLTTRNLKSEDKGFLYSQLIEALESYPMFILLLHGLNRLCERSW
ncbi:hypothetical protein MO973_03230 [Paenibacillus sp. TRM 82003]|nr:hypothetical protein [Paenibacillus sp. TRM 82003]